LFPKEGLRRANAALTNVEKSKNYEKYKEAIKSAGLWVDPEVYKTWTLAQRSAHTEKARAKRISKKGKVKPTVEITTPGVVTAPTMITPTPTVLAPTYANVTSPPPMLAMFRRTYKMAVAIYKSTANPRFMGSLIDGGCNGGLAGEDCIILETHSLGKVDIIGVGDNLIKNVPLCTAASLIQTTDGPIIGIFHNYPPLGKGGSIHSLLQMQDFGVLIDDKAKTQKRIDGEYGTQMVRVISGGSTFENMLVINGGLPYFKMTVPTQEQLDDLTIPHVTFTLDMPWDPAKYDNLIVNDQVAEVVDDDNETVINPYIDPEYDEAHTDNLAEQRDVFFGELLQEKAYDFGTDCMDEFESVSGSVCTYFDTMFQPMPNIMQVMAHLCQFTYQAKKSWLEHKYGKTIDELCPHFAFASSDWIKATIEASTQFYQASQWSKKLKQHFKSCFPGANVNQINETVCSDTAYMETKGAADGITGHSGALGFQCFVGHNSKHLVVYMVKTNKAYPICLGEYICTHGAPKKMFCDNAKAETSEAAKEIYCNFGIADGNSELYYQNQNAAEREIQDVKTEMELLMNINNTLDNMWPLCACLVKNHMACVSLNNHTPMEKHTGQTPDISKFLQFCWGEPVYFSDMNGNECLGRWAGVAEHVGDELTYIVANKSTHQAIFRSDIRTATDPNAPNFRAEVIQGMNIKPSAPKDEGVS
jgi:hypothetical protein